MAPHTIIGVLLILSFVLTGGQRRQPRRPRVYRGGDRG